MSEERICELEVRVKKLTRMLQKQKEIKKQKLNAAQTDYLNLSCISKELENENTEIKGICNI